MFYVSCRRCDFYIAWDCLLNVFPTFQLLTQLRQDSIYLTWIFSCYIEGGLLPIFGCQSCWLCPRTLDGAMTRNQYDTLPLSAFQVIHYICSFSCSPPGQKPYSNGPQRFIGPVREAEADSRFGQRQEENKDYPIFPESHLERYPNVVSIPVRSFNWWESEPAHADRETLRGHSCESES